jgi:hypothetical protein
MGSGGSKGAPAAANGNTTGNSNVYPPNPEYNTFINSLRRERLPEPYLSQSNYTEMTPEEIKLYLFDKRQERNGTSLEGGRRARRSTKKRKGRSKRTRSRR